MISGSSLFGVAVQPMQSNSQEETQPAPELESIDTYLARLSGASRRATESLFHVPSSQEDEAADADGSSDVVRRSRRRR